MVITTLLLFLGILTAGLVYLSVCGAGVFVLLQGRVPADGAAWIGAAASCGLAVLGGIATQVFYGGLAPVWVIWLGPVPTAALLAWVAWRRPAVLREAGRRLAGLRRDADLGLVAAGIALVVFLPGIRGGFSQPFRLGIDEVGYAVTADYLFRGGTRDSLQKEIVVQTAQPNLEHALNANITALSFNDSIAAEFLLKAHRIGYPMLLAGVAQAFALDPVLDYQFALLAIPWLAAVLALYWLFAEVLRWPRFLAKLAALALPLNCNLLNVLYEGQHAQIAVLPLLALYFGVLLLHRANSPDDWGLVPAAAVASLGIFALYSDAYIALGAAGVVLVFLDAGARDWGAVRRCVTFCVAVAGGMAVLGPYFLNWIGFMVRHLSNVGSGHGGWWQPYWAAPAEIAGYASMFTGPLGHPLERGWENSAVQIILGIGILAVLFLVRGWRGTAGRFWCAPVLVTVFVLIQLRLKNFHNYGYFKTYTLLLIPLVAWHWESLRQWSSGWRWASRSAGGLSLWHWACGAAVSLAMVVGLLEAVHFLRGAATLPGSKAELRLAGLSDRAVLTWPEGGIGVAMLSGVVPLNWLNISWADKKLAAHLDREVVILAFRKDLPARLAEKRPADASYWGEDFVVFRTGAKVRDLGLPEIDVNADRITTAIDWPHRQQPVTTQFLRDFWAKFARESRRTGR